MSRWMGMVLLLLCTMALAGGTAQAALTPYSSALTGAIEGSKLSGVEPDGDPLYQVVLKTRLAATAHMPAANIIVSAYMENFKPDTTPVLPDLIHPKQTAQNLGGFLQGKVLLTDDAGNVLSIGSFLNEAFLDNSNHAIISLGDIGTGKAGARGILKGTFDLHKNFTVSGRLSGRLSMTAATQRQLIARAGAKMKPLTHIIDQVTVKPSYMRGRATNSSSAPLSTGYTPTKTSSSSRHISPLTIAAGAGAVLSLLIAAVLYIVERRRAAAGPSAASS